MKHFSDAWHVRPPRTNVALRPINGLHAKNVQDDRRVATHNRTMTSLDVAIRGDDSLTDAKLAIVVRDDLMVWQKLNVTAFLVSGFGSYAPSIIGEPYVDGSDRRYLAMLVSPVLVFAGDAAAVRRAFNRAVERSIATSVYTDDMFSTFNDTDNRAAVRRVATGELGLAGFGLIGDRRQVDKALDKLRLHA